jgi:hypothetical protein
MAGYNTRQVHAPIEPIGTDEHSGHSSQAALKSGLAMSRSLAEPIGRPPVRWMVTLQSQTYGMRSVEADPADVLPAFEHRIITNAVIAASACRAQVQSSVRVRSTLLAGFFSCRPGNAQRRTKPNILAGAASVIH